MTTCTKCGAAIEDGELLAGSEVYSKMMGGADRNGLLTAYDGIRYGSSTVFCSDCLDTPSACTNCDGSGVVGSDDPGEEDEGDPAKCPKCDGTGTTKPDVLRDSCRF